jgi:8-oxo-dGTP pyrophosphatase MutT (NUDIX family)
MTKRIIKAGLCLMRGGKVLLARSEGDPHFQIPGGKIEPGETDLQALVRESQEELALSLDPEQATYLGTFSAPAAGRTNVLVEVRLYEADITVEPQASSEIAELIWQQPAHPTVACSDVVRLHILPFLERRSQGTGDIDA